MSENNGTQTQPETTAVIDEKALFHGEIVDHKLDKTKANDLKLAFRVKLKSRYLDPWNVDAGTTMKNMPELREVVATMTFTNMDEEKAAKRVKDLKSLGFVLNSGDDLRRLIPGRKGSVSFAGKPCCVRPTYSGDSLYWNIVAPRSFATQALSPEESEQMIAGELEDVFASVLPQQRKLTIAGVSATPTANGDDAPPPF